MGIKLLRYIDRYIFQLFNLTLSPLKYIFNNEKYKKSPKKILVIRFWALGSSILTFSMIKQLKVFYGDQIQYDVLTTSRTIGIYKNQQYFNNYINLLNLKDLFKLIFSFKKYDIVIDTEDYFNISSFVSIWLGKINIGFNPILSRKIAYNNPIDYNDNKHACLVFLDLLTPLGINIKTPEYLESFKYLEKDKLNVDKYLSDINNLNYKKLCFHTGGAETNSDRFWKKDNWIELINNLKDDKVIIFLSGTTFEEKGILEIIKNINNKNVFNICNEFNLREFAYFLEKSDFMISNDTGPMHLAASMKAKTIGLFGPNLPSRFGAYPLDKNVNLYKGNGKASINVHLGSFEFDKNDYVNKISVDEVYNLIICNNEK